jgi:hypothetical protein
MSVAVPPRSSMLSAHHTSIWQDYYYKMRSEYTLRTLRSEAGIPIVRVAPILGPRRPQY